LYADLPDDPYAQKDIILERIRELEVSLKTPLWLRFQPQGSNSGHVPSVQIQGL
jgi:hypothetical protein